MAIDSKKIYELYASDALEIHKFIFLGAIINTLKRLFVCFLLLCGNTL